MSHPALIISKKIAYIFTILARFLRSLDFFPKFAARGLTMADILAAWCFFVSRQHNDAKNTSFEGEEVFAQLLGCGANVFGLIQDL